LYDGWIRQEATGIIIDWRYLIQDNVGQLQEAAPKQNEYTATDKIPRLQG
jgi:hypothetical protein